MIIDFNNAERVTMENFNGGNKSTDIIRYIDSVNKIMLITLEPGASIGVHVHENGSEAIFILEGKGHALYDGTTENLTKGICHYCPKGHSHSVINDGEENLVFFAVVSIG